MNKIREINKKIYALLDYNGFEKKSDNTAPFAFSYIKRGDSFELEVKFHEREYLNTPMSATLSLLRFDLKLGLQFGYDLYERIGDDLLEYIYKELAEEYKKYLLKEIQEDLK